MVDEFETGVSHADPADSVSVEFMQMTQASILRRERPPEPVIGVLSEDDLLCRNHNCDELLPEARRRMGYTLCVACSEHFETARARRYG